MWDDSVKNEHRIRKIQQPEKILSGDVVWKHVALHVQARNQIYQSDTWNTPLNKIPREHFLVIN
jgi:hypothetical protein